MQINNAKLLFLLSPANNLGHFGGKKTFASVLTFFPKGIQTPLGWHRESLQQSVQGWQTHLICFFWLLWLGSSLFMTAMWCRELTWSRSYKNGICKVCRVNTVQKTLPNAVYHWSQLQSWINGNEDIEEHIFWRFWHYTSIIYNSVTNITVYIASALGAG